MIFFDKLSFSEVTGLYEDFQRYYKEWKTSTSTHKQDNKLESWYVM